MLPRSSELTSQLLEEQCEIRWCIRKRGLTLTLGLTKHCFSIQTSKGCSSRLHICSSLTIYGTRRVVTSGAHARLPALTPPKTTFIFDHLQQKLLPPRKTTSSLSNNCHDLCFACETQPWSRWQIEACMRV